MSLPKNSFARKIITMQGYTDEQAVGEVMHADKVSHDEALCRLAEAKAQHINRSAGQYVRYCRAKDAVDEARQQVLRIAQRPGGFICSKELEGIAAIAKWATPAGAGDTGRVFRDILLPLEREGAFREIRDEDAKFIGYIMTDEGRKKLSEVNP